MKNKKKILIISIVTMCILLIGVLLINDNSRNNKELKEEINETKSKSFAIMLQNESGGYVESDSASFPSSGYELNTTLTNCVDETGTKVEDVISYENGNIAVETNKKVYCYLYFDAFNTFAEYIIYSNSSDLWDSPLEDDGYRYVGKNPNNYVCFGYSNAETNCDFTNAANSDLYAYRIIGVFEDDFGNQHVKLIKKEALNTSYRWHSSNNDVNWDERDLYNGINGSYFLSNTNYPYMQDTTWTEKMTTWTYTMTNTLTSESSGPHYYSGVNTQNMYLHELNRSTKTNAIGEWENLSTKISLMYASDYQLSLGSSSLNYIGNSNANELKTGWMYLINNDSEAPSTTEWTMSRYGYNSGVCIAWSVWSDGYVQGSSCHAAENYYSIRPVFYLKSSINYVSGSGTSGDPFIIE